LGEAIADRVVLPSRGPIARRIRSADEAVQRVIAKRRRSSRALRWQLLKVQGPKSHP
jgi:hypothetical protein